VQSSSRSEPRDAALDAEEEARLLLREALHSPSNRLCADCSAPDPQWASSNLGVFICIACSGVHRALGTHISKVKSVQLDRWQVSEARFMLGSGNDTSRRIYEYNVPPRTPRPHYTAIGPLANQVRERWIRDKYELQLFTKEQMDLQIKRHLEEHTLSDDLWIHVLSYLSIEDLLNASLVSTHFRDLIQTLWQQKHDELWRPQLWASKEEGTMVSVPDQNWKELTLKKISLINSLKRAPRDPAYHASLDVYVFSTSEEELRARWSAFPGTPTPDDPSTRTLLIESHQINIQVCLHNAPLMSRVKIRNLAVVCLLDAQLKTVTEVESALAEWGKHVDFINAVLCLPKRADELISREKQDLIAFETGIKCTHVVDWTQKSDVMDALTLLVEQAISSFALDGWPGVTAPPIWIPDSASPFCTQCNQLFTLIVRRHHCRSCGALVCQNCSSKKLALPLIYPSKGSQQKHRVCARCYQDRQ